MLTSLLAVKDAVGFHGWQAPKGLGQTVKEDRENY